MKKKAVLIVGHGSKLKGFQRPMEQLARRLRQRKQYLIVLCAYLEITPPSIVDAIEHCIKKGADEVLVLPYFLLMGNHVKIDIPRIVSRAKKRYAKQAEIRLCPYLGYDDRLAEVAEKRLRAVG